MQVAAIVEIMESSAKTIQIFLPDGEPRGLRIAEITTRLVKAVLVPRSKLSSAGRRQELNNVGVYFLFGESEEEAKPSVYIGEAEDCYSRLVQHNRSKDFWNTAVVMVSKTDAFTKAHVKYLEWYCVGRAKDIARFGLENSTIPSEPYVTEPMLADLTDSFDTLGVLLSTLGFPIFEPVRRALPTTLSTTGEQEEADEEDLFFCTGGGAKAEGRLLEDGFVVYQGSLGRSRIAPSANKPLATFREKLMSGGILAIEGDQLVFKEYYLFNSPSAAALVVLGRKANGWVEWKRSDGKTLDEVKRQVSPSS